MLVPIGGDKRRRTGTAVIKEYLAKRAWTWNRFATNAWRSLDCVSPCSSLSSKEYLFAYLSPLTMEVTIKSSEHISIFDAVVISEVLLNERDRAAADDWTTRPAAPLFSCFGCDSMENNPFAYRNSVPSPGQIRITKEVDSMLKTQYSRGFLLIAVGIVAVVGCMVGQTSREQGDLTQRTGPWAVILESVTACLQAASAVTTTGRTTRA